MHPSSPRDNLGSLWEYLQQDSLWRVLFFAFEGKLLTFEKIYDIIKLVNGLTSKFAVDEEVICMKRFCVFLSLLMLFGLAGCTDVENSNKNTATELGNIHIRSSSDISDT